jgi:CheY-like chemotaxis protein/HPt (histidine-containing phosphotransfer) domain-containing protein
VRQSSLFDAFARIADPEHDTAQHPIIAETTPEFSARVLLAEDNIVNQRLAVSMLEKLGCQVDVVANGAEAVTMFRKLPYDAVLMDCQMPEMDGFEATGEIRKNQSTIGAPVPIIAMTANAMTGDREQCLAAGMDAYLSKPVNFNDLAQTLGRWLRQTPPGAKSSAARPRTEIVSRHILDKNILREIRADLGDSDPTLIENLITDFQNLLPPGAEQLLAALKEGHLENARQAAHKYKGSCRIIGALALANTCERIERATDKQDLEKARQWGEVFQKEVQDTLEAVRALDGGKKL